MSPPKAKETYQASKRSRRVKEVVLDQPSSKQEQSEQNDELSQMDVLRQRLAALEERDSKLRAGTYKASGKNHDFELNTNLSSFM